MTDTTTPTVDVRRAADRAATRIGWLDSQHSFSFGSHGDPDNTHHGLLLVNNDDIVTPGAGFGTPPPPGLRRQPRGHLPRAGTADERRHRHLALREERRLAGRRRPRPRRAGPLHPDVGAA